MNDKPSVTERIELQDINPSTGTYSLQPLPPSLPPPKPLPSSSTELTGMLYAFIAIFFRAFGTFYTKLIQKTYPSKFHTVPFLWLRSFTIITFALLHTKVTGIPIIKPKDIPFKKWFFYRTNMNFFGVSLLTLALWYLRASTAQIINSLRPIIVLILSHFILNEQYYMRYTIGTAMCLIGTSIIIYNELKIDSNKNEHNTSIQSTPSTSLWDTIKGLLFVSLSMLSVTLVDIANKILASNKVPINTQMLYVGISTMTYSTVFIIIFGGVELDPGYLLMCLFHGVFFYLANISYNKALQLAPISRLIIINYTQIVFVYILAFLFLNERIYVSDLIGAGIMFSYMVYNGVYPIKDDNK
jgi:drug/metabolite transporter (DMT)-like permease